MTERPEASEQSRELHVVFGTGPVGLAVADELSLRRRRVRTRSSPERPARELL